MQLLAGRRHPLHRQQHRGVGRITAGQIKAFAALFRRGILSAARANWPEPRTVTLAAVAPREMVGLLIRSGVDPRGMDVRGV